MTTSTLPAKFSPTQVVASGVEDGVEWITYPAPIYGAINGYVRLPEDHPWRGLDYDHIDVAVNGGLTFHSGDWIGFDTLHAGDYWPGNPYGPHSGDVHWTASMVADECRLLARQVAEATK
jgi:hypothetical protein